MPKRLAGVLDVEIQREAAGTPLDRIRAPLRKLEFTTLISNPSTAKAFEVSGDRLVLVHSVGALPGKWIVRDPLCSCH